MTQATTDSFPAQVTQSPSADTNQQPTNTIVASRDDAANTAENAQATSQSNVVTTTAATNSTGKVSEHSPFANEPYEFERCTLTVVLQFWPQDDNLHGRMVVVSARNHQDKPLLRLAREHELGALPPVVCALLEQLRAELPERQQAHAEREAIEANKRTAPTAAPTRQSAKSTKAKKGVSAANPTTQTPSLAQPPAPPRPLAPAPPVVSTDQLGLFQTEA